MAEQLTFELAPEPAPTFANFVAGPNAEACEALVRFAAALLPETGVLVWGAPGAGKSHLLRAMAAAAAGAGRPVRHCAHPDEMSAAPLEARALVCVDEVDRAGDAAQGRLFTLYNALAASGGQLAAAAAVPPARLPLREDVRTRLGWGLVYEVVPLADEAKPAALATFARQRGFHLGDDAIAYLLAHGRRDMASLVRSLIALDAHSLAHKRPITVPLIRAWLQRELALPGGGAAAGDDQDAAGG
jgi:DnaA family protein